MLLVDNWAELGARGESQQQEVPATLWPVERKVDKEALAPISLLLTSPEGLSWHPGIRAIDFYLNIIVFGLCP